MKFVNNTMANQHIETASGAISLKPGESKNVDETKVTKHELRRVLKILTVDKARPKKKVEPKPSTIFNKKEDK